MSRKIEFFVVSLMTFAVLRSACAAVFTTSLAERPDEPVPPGAMPSDWIEHPFLEPNPEPKLSDAERDVGFMTFSRAITEPVYQESKPQDGERISSLRGFAAQGERAQFNFAVYPDRDLTDFSAAADTPFPATLEQITYSPFIYAHYHTRGKYRVGPAYLVPAAKSRLRKGEPLRYVLAVKVPCDAKPGRYLGRVRLGHASNPAAKEIPLELTVLPFRLKRDPSQYRSAYVGAKYDMAKTVEYGFSIPGTIYINYDSKGDRFYVPDIDGLEMKWKKLTGEKPRRYIALANFSGMLYRRYMKEPAVKGSIKMPPDAFFEDIERCGREFLSRWKTEGRAELFVIAADEPRVEDVKYVARLFRSFKKAGFNTFVTSWSAREPSLEAELKDYVDVWCDQFFVTPEKRVASGKREHWCYPNHNVFELKDAPTMARGSRMTWGFGLWKMGDSTLVPWAWSWKMNTSDIPQLARGTQVMKPDGTEWIEWIWEGVFAGTIDAAYIYTLQDAVFRRGGPPEARKLLQELYASVPAQAKYLASNHWTGERFDTSRALIAEMIVKTLKYREKTQGVCPSVLPGLKWNGMTSDNNVLLPEAEKSGCLVRRKLSEMPIWPCETGCKVKRLSDGAFRSTITVNHETSEDGGHYKRSSPAVAVNLAKGNPPVNLNDYGFLRFDIRYHSNRSAEQVGKWPHSILFTSSSEAGKRTHSSILPDTEPAADQWHSCLYSLDRLNFSAIERSNISLLRWMFMERDYNHGEVLEFEIRNAELIGAKCPIVLSFSASAAISPAQSVVWNARVFGPIPPSGAKGKIVMRKSDGTIVGWNGICVTQPEAKGVLIPQAPLMDGEYLLEIMFDKLDGVQGPKAKCSMRVVDLACR
jgi:hypothetical protein